MRYSVCWCGVLAADEEWAVRIRNLKFEAFNQEWLEVVASPDQVREGSTGAVWAVLHSLCSSTAQLAGSEV